MNEENLRKKMGELISYLRLEKRLTQKELAKLSDLSISTLIDVENGYHNVTVLTLFHLCKGLNIELSQFFQLLENNNEVSLIKKSNIFKTPNNGDLVYSLMKKLKNENKLPLHWKEIEKIFKIEYGFIPKDLNQVLADLSHHIYYNNYPSIGKVIFQRTSRGTYTLL